MLRAHESASSSACCRRLVLGDELADAVLGVHAGAAQVLHRDPLTKRRFDDPRAGQEHARRLGHDHEVGERR